MQVLLFRIFDAEKSLVLPVLVVDFSKSVLKSTASNKSHTLGLQNYIS